MAALKAEGLLLRRVRLRQCKYLNKIVEQDHRNVEKRIWLAKGYGSFQSAWRTLQGIETMHMINKGRVRCLAKGDAHGQAYVIAVIANRIDPLDPPTSSPAEPLAGSILEAGSRGPMAVARDYLRGGKRLAGFSFKEGLPDIAELV